MIINEKAPLSRAMFGELQRHAPPGVPVLQPEPEDPDVWQVLGGDKDDFLVYDRCGRLAFHIQLPFSFLHFPYVESAIRFTHSKDFCGNCSLYPNTTREVRAGM
ncbi:SELPB protein, partial [Xiphorhynchus elegans]|nr:SELPB protein [Xiphorhynchus elegans]